MKTASVNTLILIECFFASTNAFSYINLCGLFKNNTILQSPVRYNEYITCPAGAYRRCDVVDNIYEPNKGTCTENYKLFHSRINPCFYAEDNTKMAYTLVCNAYLLCKSKTPKLLFCEGNYHFDQEKQMCVPPEGSQCAAGINNICQLAADGTLFIDKKYCSKYYKCENGKPLKMDCRDLYFDVETGKCIDQPLFNCPCPNYMLPNDVVFIPDGFSCRGYYRCEGRSGEATYRKWEMCPSGTYFHENSQTCLSPDLHDIKCTRDTLAATEID